MAANEIRLSMLGLCDVPACDTDRTQSILGLVGDSGVHCGFLEELNYVGNTLQTGIASIKFTRGSKCGLANVCVESDCTIAIANGRCLAITIPASFINNPTSTCGGDFADGTGIATLATYPTNSVPANSIKLRCRNGGVLEDCREYLGISSEVDNKKFICTKTAGQFIDVGDALVVRPSDGVVIKADANSTNPDAKGFCGIALNSGGTGSNIQIQTGGVVDVFDGQPQFTQDGVCAYLSTTTGNIVPSSSTQFDSNICYPIGKYICGKLHISAMAGCLAEFDLFNKVKSLIKDPCLYVALETIDVGDAVGTDSSGGIVRADANGAANDQNFIGFAVTSGAAGSLVEVQTSGIYCNPDGAQGPNGSPAYLSNSAGNIQTTPPASGGYPVGIFTCDNCIEICSCYIQMENACPKCDIVTFQSLITFNQNTPTIQTRNINIAHLVDCPGRCIDSKIWITGRSFTPFTNESYIEGTTKTGYRCNGEQYTCGSRQIGNSITTDAQAGVMYRCLQVGAQNTQYGGEVTITNITGSTISLTINHIADGSPTNQGQQRIKGILKIQR